TFGGRIRAWPRSTQNECSERDVQAKIAALMEATLAKRDTVSPDGRKVWLPVPPSTETIRQVRACGNSVRVLAEYSRSGSYHERELALEFLHYVAGGEVVEALARAARADREPRLRTEALRYLVQESWEVADPILREASRADPDAKVREYAKYELESHAARAAVAAPESMIRKRIGALIRHTIDSANLVTSDGVRVQTV